MLSCASCYCVSFFDFLHMFLFFVTVFHVFAFGFHVFHCFSSFLNSFNEQNCLLKCVGEGLVPDVSCHRQLNLYPKFLHISHRENGSFEVLSLHENAGTI